MSSTMAGQVPSYPGIDQAAFVDIASHSTWYADTGGPKPTILCVYGGNFGPVDKAGGSNAAAWSSIFTPLSQSHRVIVYDKLGHGFSDSPGDDANQYTMAAVVNHLVALIETLDIGDLHLVGHSRGGYIAARLALLRQDLVRSLTVVSSGTLSPGVGTNAVALAGCPYPCDTREARRWVYERYCYDDSAVTEEWVDAACLTLDAPGYAAARDTVVAGQLLERKFWPELAQEKRETLSWLAEGRLQRPALVIWGRNDLTARVDLALDVFELFAAHERNTILSIVDKCGHFPYREHPKWFCDALTSFIERVEDGF